MRPFGFLVHYHRHRAYLLRGVLGHLVEGPKLAGRRRAAPVGAFRRCNGYIWLLGFGLFLLNFEGWQGHLFFLEVEIEFFFRSPEHHFHSVSLVVAAYLELQCAPRCAVRSGDLERVLGLVCVLQFEYLG